MYLSHETNITYSGDKANWQDIELTGGRPSQHHYPVIEDGAHTGEWEIDLNVAKEQKRAEIELIKTQKQLAGFTYDSMQFQFDEVAIARINATWNFAQVDSEHTQPFILQDNTIVTLTNTQCIGLGYACGQHVSSITIQARQLKNVVLAAETVAEVEAVTWPE